MTTAYTIARTDIDTLQETIEQIEEHAMRRGLEDIAEIAREVDRWAHQTVEGAFGYRMQARRELRSMANFLRQEVRLLGVATTGLTMIELAQILNSQCRTLAK